jgi:hypothetical protein
MQDFLWQTMTRHFRKERKMKASMKRALALLTAFVLTVSMIPVPDVSAAAKPKLSKTNVTVTVGETAGISVKNTLWGGIKRLGLQHQRRSLQ